MTAGKGKAMKLNVNQYQVHVSGNAAIAIERAYRDSFNGIFGTGPSCAKGYIAARDAVEAFLAENGLRPAWYLLTAAKEQATGNSWPEYILTVTTA